MSFTMPYYLQPLLDFYNLKWPDIDEDQVAELGVQIKDVATSAHNFANAVERCLGTLSDDSSSDALEAMHGAFSTFTSGPVLKVTDNFGEGAATGCGLVRDGIGLYKDGVAVALFINVGSDVALIVSGVGIPAAIAKKAVMREILEIALDQLALQWSDYLLGQWNNFLDEHVFSHIEDLAKEIRENIAGSAADIVSMALPIHGAQVAIASLYIDHDDVVHAATAMKSAYDELSGAISKLASWSKGSGYTTPLTASPDPTLRAVMKEAFDWAVDQIAKLVDDIGNAIVNNVIDVITGIYDKYVEADTSLAGRAEELRDQFKLPPPAVPFHIDRSTRPKPIYILDAPPVVVTGPGVSDARNGIVVINLPDAPDPVVTGVAESDARLDIRQILLPTAPEPVRTGPGTSEAHNDIQEIVLPSADQPE